MYSATCRLCYDGSYQDQTQQTSCKVCTPGQWQDEIAKSSCKLCSVGKYSTFTGRGIDCAWCDAGYITGRTGAGGSSCTSCAAGKYSTASNRASCTTCAAGQYQEYAGQASCKTCAAGSVTGRTGTGATSCTICATGRYSSTSSLTSCTACVAGKYQGSTGQTSCQSCKVYSTWTLGGVSEYRKYIASGSGASSCTECSGCQVANDAYTACVDGPQYAFREGYGVETRGVETNYHVGGLSCGTMASEHHVTSGTDYSYCLERCYAHCANWHGFIVRYDGRCWCENHGGYKVTQTCDLQVSSGYHLYGIVKCGANSAARPDSNWRVYGNSKRNTKPCTSWTSYLGNHNHDKYGLGQDHYIVQPVPAYTKVYDGECTSGSEYRKFEGNGDNSGPTYVDECARQCTGYVSFIIVPSGSQKGRCYCENLKKTQCSLASNHYDKYDFN